MYSIQLAGVICIFIIALDMVHCVTPSEQCTNEHFDNLRERVQVIPCGASRCRLQRGTNVTVIFNFRPKFQVKSLTNKVYATIAGIGGLPLPFVGVDGVSACQHVTRAADSAPAPCPLASDQEYAYTNVFFIESFYPITQLQVHWSLHDGARDVICFEVPATITPEKKKN